MDSQQELFTKLKIELERGDYDVYDGYLPPPKTPYPFIYLANSQLVDEMVKCGEKSNIFQTIQVWHDNPMKRGTMSKIILFVKSVARQLTETDNYKFMLVGINQQILQDDTTDNPLLHGEIQLEYKCVRR